MQPAPSRDPAAGSRGRSAGGDQRRSGPSGGGAPAVLRRPAVGWALRVAAGLLVLAAVVTVVGGDAVLAGTAVLAPAPVAAAVALGLLWRALAATRWVVLARVLGAPLRWPQAYGEYLRSELLNQVLPGAVLGDVDRARRHGADVGVLAAARAVALERAVGHAVLVVGVVAVLLARPELRRVGQGADETTVAVVAGALALLVAGALLLWQPWRRHRRGVGDLAAAGVGGAGVGGAGVGGAGVGGAGLGGAGLGGAGLGGAGLGGADGAVRGALLPGLLAAVALSVGVLACFVTLFVLAAHATGPDTSPAALVPAVLVVLVLAGIPLTVAGWGAREAGAALCFAAVGLAAADGVSAAVGYGLLSLVSALPGLVPLLLPRLRTAPR